MSDEYTQGSAPDEESSSPVPEPLAEEQAAQPGETQPMAPEGDEPAADGVVGGDDVPPKRPQWVWWAIGAAVVVALIALYLFMRPADVAVPNVVGLPEAQAKTALESVGLRAGTVSEVETLVAAPGTVVEQTPSAKREVPEGSAVALSISAVPVVQVPDVVGMTASEANETLALAGLQTGAVEYAYDDGAEAGHVIAQEPAAGESVIIGSKVSGTISKGEQQEQVPNVIGLSADDADDLLSAAGFEVKTIKAESKSVPAGDVMAQSPAAGVVAEAGSTVTITVSTGVPAPPATEPEAPEEPAAQPTEPASPQESEKPSAQPTEPAAPERPETPEPSPEGATVPNVVGQGILEAIQSLRAAQLKVDFTFGPSADYVLKIAEQDPAAGTEVERGTVVTLTIGLPSFTFDLSAEQLPAPEQTPEATETPGDSAPVEPPAVEVVPPAEGSSEATQQ